MVQFEIFNNLLTAPRTVSNTCAQVARAQLCANQVQRIERSSRATCRVACHVVGRDSTAIKAEFKSQLFKLYCIDRTMKPLKEGRKPEYPEKTPGDELQNPQHNLHGEATCPHNHRTFTSAAAVVVCWLLNFPATC